MNADQLILEQDIAGLAEAMNRGAVTSRELVQAYLDRIARLDTGPTGLNSVQLVNSDALWAAQ